MRHGHELAAPPDEDIPLAIGERGVEQRDVGLDRGKRHDAVAGLEGVLDDLPILAMREEVASQNAAQRHEGEAFDGGLKRRVDRGTSRVLERDLAAAHRLDEARRRPKFAERHGRGLDDVDRARADQQFGLKPAHRNADEMEMLHPAPDEGARRRHGRARIIGRHRELRAIGDGGGEIVQIADLILAHGNLSSACDLKRDPKRCTPSAVEITGILHISGAGSSQKDIRPAMNALARVAGWRAWLRSRNHCLHPAETFGRGRSRLVFAADEPRPAEPIDTSKDLAMVQFAEVRLRPAGHAGDLDMADP